MDGVCVSAPDSCIQDCPFLVDPLITNTSSFHFVIAPKRNGDVSWYWSQHTSFKWHQKRTSQLL